MKTTTVPKIIFHTFIDNDTSLIDKLQHIFDVQTILIDMKQKIIKQILFFKISARDQPIYRQEQTRTDKNRQEAFL